ncbi:HlyD family secretion protein [Bacteroidota bacterium]
MMKKKNNVLPDLNVRSEEVQEIVGFIPHWIIRLGISIITIIFFVFIIGSWFFKYPDILRAPIELTTTFPPSPVVTKTNGTIQEIFVNDGDKVSKNDSLIVIENGSEFSDVMEVKSILSIYADFIKSFNELYFDSINFRQDVNIGELQAGYSALLKSYENYVHYIRTDIYSASKRMKEKELGNYRVLYEREYQLRDLAEDDLTLAQKSLERFQLLNKSGAKTEVELEEENARYLQIHQAFIRTKTTLSETNIIIDGLKRDLLFLDNENSNKIKDLKHNIEETFNHFKSELTAWELKYVLKAATSGIISFNSKYSTGLNLNDNVTVMYIVPEITGRMLGKVQLPARGAGKVEIGLDVNIKFDNFPYMEYGIVRAVINSKSLVPDKNVYNLELIFPDSLRTNYKKDLKFSQSMHGQAEIITEDISLLIRILNPLKSLFKKHIDKN